MRRCPAFPELVRGHVFRKPMFSVSRVYIQIPKTYMYMYSTVGSFLLTGRNTRGKWKKMCSPAGPPCPSFAPKLPMRGRGKAPRPRRAARAGSDRTQEIHPRGEGRGARRFLNRSARGKCRGGCYGRGRGIALLPTPRRARSWQLHALEALPLNSLPNALVSQPSAFRPTPLALSGHPSGGRRQRGEPSDGDQLIHGRLRWRRAGATQP